MIRAQADVAATGDTEYAYVAAVARLPRVRYVETDDGFAEARRWIPVLAGDLVYRAPLPGGVA